MTRIPILFTAALAAACTTADPAPLDDEAAEPTDKAVPACPQPLIHDLPEFHGACEYGTTRCNGTTVEICGNDDTGYLSWEYVATCATTCTGDGTCGAPSTLGVDLSDDEVAALVAEVEAQCVADTGEPSCGQAPTSVDPSGSLMAAIESLEVDPGPACVSCHAFSNQPCSCDPLENPSTACYDEANEPPQGTLYAWLPLFKLASYTYKIFKGGAKVAGLSRSFLGHYQKAQSAYDKSVVAVAQGKTILAKALAREAVAECGKATAHLSLAAANLVATGQLIKRAAQEFKANPDANEVVITVDGEIHNITREQYNELAKTWKNNVKHLKGQVNDLDKLQQDAERIARDD